MAYGMEPSNLAFEVSHNAKGKQSGHSKMDNGGKHHLAVTPAKAVPYSSPTTGFQFWGGGYTTQRLRAKQKSSANSKARNGWDHWG